MSLDPVFVFGSNLAGRHGKGAALFALQRRGAQYGVARGPMGNAYAIPTRSSKLYTLSLTAIMNEVDDFKRYAARNPEKKFLVTRIGCGLAGYRDDQIAPMFRGISANCIMPPEWKPYL